MNVFLITMVAGLAEAAHFATGQGVPLSTFLQVIDAGPMTSDVSRGKLAKIVERDFSPQAAISDGHYNSLLATEAAAVSDVCTPLLAVSERLFGEAAGLGLGSRDMAAVICALEARSEARRRGRRA